MTWHGWNLSTGGRDHSINNRDVREPPRHRIQISGHQQEVGSARWRILLLCVLRNQHLKQVCGLKYSMEGQLASGGNDNKLLIWDMRNTTLPIVRFEDHKAAVKAIAWSPCTSGLIVSGGGTFDHTIRFRNTRTAEVLNVIDVKSQVCNMCWSKTSNEIVTTHGWSQHQVTLWQYPKMQPLVNLLGHTCRVLYLAAAPDDQSIVTGSGDETLRCVV